MKIGPINISLETKKPVADSDAKRPVKFVPDGVNSWRVVWDDAVSSK